MDITLVAQQELEQSVLGLVDSGSEHTLIAPWLARHVGMDPHEGTWRTVLGIAGESIEVAFSQLTMRLHPPAGSPDDYVEWEAEVGFVDRWRPPWGVLLGQIGFLDRFTVTMHRHAQALVVEDFDSFDRRFGSELEKAERRRRLLPP